MENGNIEVLVESLTVVNPLDPAPPGEEDVSPTLEKAQSNVQDPLPGMKYSGFRLCFFL